LKSLLEGKEARSEPQPDRIQKIAEYVGYAQRLGRPLVRPGCLTRELTLYYFLRRAGLDVELCFGMGYVSNEFAGHCWLVKDGEPFMEAKDPRSLFTEVYRFGQSVTAFCELEVKALQ
jgi:hypothetical protein